jgi:hypothetical protein
LGRGAGGSVLLGALREAPDIARAGTRVVEGAGVAGAGGLGDVSSTAAVVGGSLVVTRAAVGTDK